MLDENEKLKHQHVVKYRTIVAQYIPMNWRSMWIQWRWFWYYGMKGRQEG
jgi:hypothetical protein